MLKRAFDVTVVLLLTPVLLPLSGCVATVILLSLGRPVLFRQLRPGLGGRPFVLYKFRTMRPPEGAVGSVDVSPPQTSEEDDARLSRVGSLIRATSLDELPQLWNVLRGDMSLVGPRPLLMDYLPHYTPEQARRHHVRPGITGLAQVTGRHDLDWTERFSLDVQYVDHHSMRLDLLILARTLRTALGRPREDVDLPPFDHDRPAPAGGST